MKKSYLVSMALFSLAAMLLFLSGCLQDNDVQNSILNKKFFSEAAKYTEYNTHSGNTHQGVFGLELFGTQSFDEASFAWPEEGFDASTDTITIINNRNRSIYKYLRWATPYPDGTSDSFNEPFADGTYADNLALYNGISPMFASTISYSYFDRDNNQAYADSGSYTYSDSISLAFSSDGIPETAVYERTVVDPKSSGLSKGVTAYKESSSFESNPFDGTFILKNVDYYSTESSQLVLIGSVVISNERDVQSYSTVDSREFTCKDRLQNVSADFNEDGDASDDVDCYGAFSQADTYLKYGDTYYLRTTITETLNTDEKTNQLTKVYYTGEFSYTENARTNVLTTYEELDRKFISAIEKSYYDSTSGSLSLTSQIKESYESDELIKTQNYDINSGVAELSSTISYSRDSGNANKISESTTSNASGTTTKSTTVSYDSLGRKTELLAYNVSGNSKWCDYKETYEYSENDSSEKTFVKKEYGCQGSEFSSEPTKQTSNVFNAMGLRLTYQTIEYDGSGNITGGSQETWEWDSSGFMTKHQKYDVTAPSGQFTAEAVDYYTYERDDNLFQTSKRHYDKNGDLCITDEVDDDNDGVNASYVCNSACSASTACYRVASYSY